VSARKLPFKKARCLCFEQAEIYFPHSRVCRK
jgi:hypothetical protein